MNQTRVISIGCLMVLFSLLTVATSQTKRKSTAKPEPSVDEQMQHEMQDASPSEAHSRLAKLAGEYTTSSKFYMQPGTSAMESSGEARLEMTLDGRFLSEHETGTLMNQPLKAFKMLGYNNASKRYEGIWTYTMSTAIMTLNGASADGGKTIKLDGSFAGAGPARERLSIVVRSIDDSRFEVELSGNLPNGKPGPRQITTYTRKK